MKDRTTNSPEAAMFQKLVPAASNVRFFHPDTTYILRITKPQGLEMLDLNLGEFMMNGPPRALHLTSAELSKLDRALEFAARRPRGGGIARNIRARIKALRQRAGLL